MTIVEAKNKVSNTAIGEVGYIETGKNITKYAEYFDKNCPNFYNTKKQGAEWCDLFNDYCFVVTFGEDTARKMLYQPIKSAGAGCKYSANYYKQNNAFYKTPEYGDQIFFYVGGEINHTGRVVGVSNTQVMTVEGNSANAVRQKMYNLTDKSIAGYGRPNWSLVANVPQPTPQPVGGTFMIEMQVLSFGSIGEQVKTMQRLLRELNFVGANGKPLTIDGQFGSNCVFAVKTAQKQWNMGQDGICGQKTWTKLLKG